MTQAPAIPLFEPSNAQAAIAPIRGLWGHVWDRLVGSWVAIICLVITLAYLAVGLLGLLPAVAHKIEVPVGGEFLPPHFIWNQPAGWFGTDIMGKSVFWEIIYGTRLALILAVTASVISSVIGTVLGIVAGFFGGWVDSLVIWIFSTFNSVPWILLAIAIAAALQTHEGLNARFSGLPAVILALSLTSWIGLCRLIRGEVLKIREVDYVTAARAVGLPNRSILFRHVLPNVFHLIIIDFSLNIVGNVQAEVVLAFLGLGVTQKPSWGRMIDDSKLDLLRGVWWQLAAATMAIFILSLAMNLLGDVLRDALDPRLRGVD